jgi:hypothetical protein
LRPPAGPLLLVALAGCADPAPPARPTQAPAAPQTAAAPEAHPEPEPEPVLGERAFGRLRIGMSGEQARGALGGALVLGDPIGTDEGPDGCRYGTSAALPPGTSLMFEGQRLVRVDVDSASVRTANGAGVGDAEAAVLARYPAARVLPHHYVEGHYLVVIPGAPADSLHRIVFETDGSRVTSMRGGIHPQVEYVEGCA